MKSVSILGASGYTGRELARLLSRHPELELDGFFSARENGHEAAPETPELECDRAVEPLDWTRVARSAGVFLCTPHGTSATLAKRCLALGAKVVDLSADFRLGSPELYRATYGHEHPAPELLAEAVYGLVEHARDRVATARLVANPGCYPTSVLLPLLPLLEAGALDARAPIVADAKSGTSGAGKTPSARMHFGSVHENFLAYGIGTHRHGPEIALHAGSDRIAFVPHLLPVFRGILTTIYVTPRAGLGAADLRALLADRYRGERFVRVFQRGLPELDRVNRTNECHIAVAEAGPQVVLVAAIDNLVKGAAGQALQNMNLALGCEEGAGALVKLLVKVGGAQLEDPAARAELAASVASARRAGHTLALVHGGGNQIRTLVRALGLPERYHEGLRVTDAATADVVLMVLAGLVNKELVQALGAAGVRAAGLCGADGASFGARRTEVAGVDLGYVGSVAAADPTLVSVLLEAGFLPVIATTAPLAQGASGPNDRFYNINADLAAGPLARAIGADALLFLTDVPAVLDAEKRRIPALSPASATKLRAEGVLSGGMIPKVDAALAALAALPHGTVKIASASGADAIRAALDPQNGTRFLAEESR